MNNFAKLDDRQDLLKSITTLEQELSAKTGKEVTLVAYSPIKHAALSEDTEALAKITELEQCSARRPARILPWSHSLCKTIDRRCQAPAVILIYQSEPI